MTLVKRLVKGSEITAAEHDANLDHVLSMANMAEAAAAKVMTADERNKLAGIEPLADVTDTAALLARANHTGSEATATIYVEKIGSDANVGTHPDLPKLTFASAITAASGLITDGAAGVFVKGKDGGEYVENLSIPSAVSIHAPAATLVGNHDITGTASVNFKTYYNEGNTWTFDVLSAVGGNVHIWGQVMDTRGRDGLNTNGDGIRNASSGAICNIYIAQIYVSGGGIGIRDHNTGGFGHIHYRGNDIYLAGNNAIGISASASGTKILADCDHILEIGSFTNTRGILFAGTAAAQVWFRGAEIVADIAYSVTVEGDLYLSCPKITGTQTGTPTQLMLGTADGVALRVVVPASASASGAVGQWAADGTHFYVCTAPDTWLRVAIATWP